MIFVKNLYALSTHHSLTTFAQYFLGTQVLQESTRHLSLYSLSKVCIDMLEYWYGVARMWPDFTVKLLVPAATLEKMLIYKQKEDWKKVLVEKFGAASLPIEYGGTASMEKLCKKFEREQGL